MSIQIYENDQYQNDVNKKPKVIAEIIQLEEKQW